jgi:predicted kinase
VSDPELWIVTGVSAAGKSTVGQALAERLDPSAHVRGDVFRRFVVNGRLEMGLDASPEAIAQLRHRYRLGVQTAESFVAEGFTTVLQDVILGPALDEVLATVRVRPAHLVVLAPSVDAVLLREAGRSKSGYDRFTAEALDQLLRTETPRRGLWLDTSDLTVDDTVDEVLDRAVESLLPSVRGGR